MTKDEKLIRKINQNLDTSKVTEAVLATDDRVLARITDGIYRQPASALRELIANAYDADATTVYVDTDWPRFSRITIRDNGNGLTIEALASLVHHIGGSPKRTQAGVGLGVVNPKNPNLSPGGRKLIGKIGIGLFSVAQLTRHFQVITKTKGSSYRHVAEVTMKTYSEEDIAALPDRDNVEIETGVVRIQSFPAEKKSEHGTEIILLDLRQQTKDLLRSRDIWLGVDATTKPGQPPDESLVPRYHIGRLEPGSEDILSVPERLPWERSDAPGGRFAKLFQAVVNEVGDTGPNPKLETILDNYLRTLWTLSLSAPIDYIDKHPFDLTGRDDPTVYHLSNSTKGQATRISLRRDETIRERLRLSAPSRGGKTPFSIFVDEVELRRPIRFNKLPATSQAIKKPILFVGKCAPDLSAVPKEIRGGDLEFEAYFLWTPKVVPKENTGLMIRINDASGTPFDDSFMKYQISEQTRLRQITSEVFVVEGLDAALNIDRESFNFANPHYQILTKWVHNALRQLANTHKALASDIRTEKKKEEHAERSQRLDQTITEALELAGIDPDSDAPAVVFSDGDGENLKAERSKGTLAFDSEVVFASVPRGTRSSHGRRDARQILVEKVKGIAQVLDAYGAFEGLTYEKQEQLLRSIVSIFVTGD
jgi:hypothetical protein